MGLTFALAVAAPVPQSASAGDGRAPPLGSADDPLRALLTRHGYVAVPIDQADPTRPVVRGQVNGHPAVFLIDTATSESSLRRDAVDKFKLPVTMHGKVKVSGAQTSGDAERATATVERLTIGDAQMPHCQLAIHDRLAGLDPAARQKAQQNDPVVGIIGDNTLVPNRCVVDLGGGTLYIRRPESAPDRWLPHELATFFAAEKYVQSPCTKLAFPWLHCKLGRHDLLLIVDTGSRFAMFDHATAARLGFKGTELPPDRGPMVAPGGKPTTSGPLPAPLVFPGGFQVPERTPVLAYDFTVGNRVLSQQGLPDAAGVVGVDLLRRYSAAIDYSTYEPRLFLIDPSVKDRRMLVGR
jgi:predicted aspartyl protease